MKCGEREDRGDLKHLRLEGQLINFPLEQHICWRLCKYSTLSSMALKRISCLFRQIIIPWVYLKHQEQSGRTWKREDKKKEAKQYQMSGDMMGRPGYQ